MTAPIAWTDPRFGVQHTPSYRDGTRISWCTVSDLGLGANLLCRYPGCGFEPLRTYHESAAEARAAGEAWLAAQSRA